MVPKIAAYHISDGIIYKSVRSSPSLNETNQSQQHITIHQRKRECTSNCKVQELKLNTNDCINLPDKSIRPNP